MRLVKNSVKACARALVRWINEDEPNASHEAPCANSYRWLEENFSKLMKDPICAKT